jgi:hypothetical protein
LPQKVGGRSARDEWNQDYLLPGALNFFPADDLIQGVVSSFDEHVGLEGGYQGLWRGLMKKGHHIYGFQTRQNQRPIVLRYNWAAWPLHSIHGAIGVHSYNHRIPELPGPVQVFHVATVKDVEAAIREHQGSLPRSTKPLEKSLPGQDLIARPSIFRHEFARPSVEEDIGVGKPYRK